MYFMMAAGLHHCVRQLIAGAKAFASQISGDIVIKLYKGNATVIQRASLNSLYSEDFATFRC